MDTATITQFAQHTFAVLQPYLPILAAKAAEEIGKKVPESVGKLWQAVKAKFAAKPAAQESVTDLLAKPGNENRQGAFLN